MGNITPQLIEQVKQAYQEQTSLSIQGNNSKHFMGRTQEANSTATPKILSTAEHKGIISYQPVELVMTARAGTTLVELQAALDEHQQMLAFEAPDFNSQATLAGTLAANLSGPARPWVGSIRDMILGTRLINGTGEHLKFGGQVMKNVAGYDLSRMQAGALGTLGVMTELSFKVLPKPEATESLQLTICANDAIILMNQLAGQPKPLSGACWHNGQLHIRLSGSARAVDKTLTQWQQDYGFNPEAKDSHFWQQLQQYQLPFFNHLENNDALWRFSINSTTKHLITDSVISPVRIPPITTSPIAISQIESNDCLIDWCGSQRWIRTSASSVQTSEINTEIGQTREQMQQLAEASGGTVSLWRGGDRQQEVNHKPNPILQRLQKNVKQAMDPVGIFNPGRLYSWM